MHFFPHCVGVNITVSLSPSNPSGIAGQNVSLNCTHTPGVGITFVTVDNQPIPNAVTAVETSSYSVFTLINVARAHNNMQYVCQYDVNTKSTASLSVWCELINELICMHLSVIIFRYSILHSIPF